MDLVEAQKDNFTSAIVQAGSVGPKSVVPRGLAGEQARSHVLVKPLLASTCTLNPVNVIARRADPWTTIVAGLLEFNGRTTPLLRSDPITEQSDCAGQDGRQAGSIKREQGMSTLKRNVRVSFVERFGAKTVSLTWHDSTQACYGEQLWMRKTARSSGRCALTGMAVRRGDAVYSPASRAAIRPLNCTQMILSAVLEKLEGGSANSWPHDFR
jgi:hypothetical protein